MNQSLGFVALLVAVSISEISYASVVRPRYIQCLNNSECMPGYCCAIGQNKFSIPQCKPMEENGGVCRPGGPITLNSTLMYPDGAEVQLTDVHLTFCPCGFGLICDAIDGVCLDPSQQPDFNSLPGDFNIQDD